MKWIILFISCIFNYSHALELKEIRVIDDGNYTSICGLSKESSESSILSAARYNRLSVNSRSVLYVQHSVLPIEIAGGCAVSVNLKFGFIGTSEIPSYGRHAFAEVILCEKSSILSGPIYDLQTRLNNEFKKYFDTCLAEIGKSY